MPILETAEARVHYEVAGDGEPLVLVPGFASGAWSWKYQVPVLAERFRVVTFDPRGIAGSQREGTSVSIGEIADDISALIDELGLGAAHVLGVSFGGFVAQQFAYAHPQKLKRLILACTSYGGAGHIAPSVEVLTAFASTEGLNSPDRIRRYLAMAFTRSFASEFADIVEDFCDLREQNLVPENVYMDQLRSAVAFDFAGRAAGIQAETLVLTGDADVVVPPENSRRLAAAIPNSELRIIFGAGHMFFVEQRDEFNGAVIDFLSR